MSIPKVEMEALKHNLVGGAIDFIRNGFKDDEKDPLIQRFKDMTESDLLAEIEDACDFESSWDGFWDMFKNLCACYSHK